MPQFRGGKGIRQAKTAEFPGLGRMDYNSSSGAFQTAPDSGAVWTPAGFRSNAIGRECVDIPLTPFRVSNDLLGDGPGLRARMRDEGYLFFRGLQKPEALLDLRLSILGILRANDWIVPDTPLMDGIADISKRCTEGDLAYADVYHQAYRLEAFHRIAHASEVMDTMRLVMDTPEVLPHPQKIIRMWFPQYTEHTTPVHQDFVHFQGNFETYTCWTPLGDCPIELGPLAVVPGSHKVDRVLDHHFSLGAGQLNVEADAYEGQWHSVDYEVGDCLMFHSLTLHRALPNETEDRLRISLDNRYTAAEAPVSDHMLSPHLNLHRPLSWEQVYADWERDDLQYYWVSDDLNVVPQDMQYSDKGMTEAMERAAQGDEEAQLHLLKAIKRDPDSDMARKAQSVLEMAVPAT